jgi:hypothetical protein
LANNHISDNYCKFKRFTGNNGLPCSKDRKNQYAVIGIGGFSPELARLKQIKWILYGVDILRG